MNHSEKFKEGLITSNMDLIRSVPKSDIHNHFYLGGDRDFIESKTGRKVCPIVSPMNSMDEMHSWVNHELTTIFKGRNGRRLALEASLRQALKDGVTTIEFGEDVWANSQFYEGNVSNIINMFKEVHESIAPNVDLKLQIGLSRHCNIDDIERWIEPFWNYSEFNSIDLYGDELAQPIKNFKSIYRKAKSKGLVLKAHVGEWGDSNSVMEAVEELELDEVQHGIAAAKSTQITKWLANHKTQLNICPTSNILLGRVESLSNHPIRKLYSQGVNVTINSDDVLLFDSDVSKEYLRLYNAGILSVDELNEIRLYGLSR